MKKKQFTYIIIAVFGFIHSSCSNNNNDLATYRGGSVTRSYLTKHINKSKYKKYSNDEKLSTIQKFSMRKVIYDYSEELIIDKSINNKTKQILNDEKLERVFDYILKKYSVSDSTLDFIYNAELVDYTVQDILVTHRLSFSEHKDRSPQEAYKLAAIIRKRIDNNDITFDEAVSIYADHPTVEIRNGMMGPLRYGKLPKELDDIIWQSMPGDINGPLETKFGYHVFHIVKREQRKQPVAKNRKKTLRREIENGRYKLLDHYTDIFAEEWFKIFDIELFIENIDTLWQRAEDLDLFVVPEGVSILRLNEAGYQAPLARINDQMVTVDWFIEQAQQHGNYEQSNFVKAYFLYNTLIDLLRRYSAVMWYDISDDQFNNKKMRQMVLSKQETLLYKHYVAQETKIDSMLTEEMIFNRLALKYNIQVRKDLTLD
jgi:hypothetical protein